MKTSININLFGTVYAIDEDAHQLLEQYLDNMKSYFSKQQGGDEIADDIEHRVAEHFWTLKEQGNESITIEQVTDILQQIGNPEQMDDKAQDAEEKKEESPNAEPESKTPETDKNESQQNNAQGMKDWLHQRRFYRDPKDKLLGGVISGATHYFGGSDPLPWRLALCVLCVVLLNYDCFIYLLLLYLLFWLIAPEAKTAEDRLKMQGKPVNPDNIKSEVISSNNVSAQPQSDSQAHGCLSGFVNVIAICVKALLILIGGALLLSLIIPIVVIGVLIFNASSLQMVPGFDTGLSQFMADEKWMLLAGLLAVIVTVILPLYALYRLLIRQRRPLSGLTTVLLVLIWLASVIFGFSNAIRLSGRAQNSDYHFDWNMVNDLDDEDYEGEQTDTQLQVEPFHAFEMRGVGQIIFTQADSCSFRMEGRKRLCEKTMAEVKDGTLCISQKSGMLNNTNNGALTIYLTAPSLDEIILEGVGEVEVPEPIEFDHPLEVTLNGVGSIDIDKVSCPKLTAHQKGVGKTSLGVETDSLILRCRGVGEMEIEGNTHFYKKDDSAMTAKIEDANLNINSL